MQERIITALIMIVILVGIVFFVPILFSPLIAVVLGIAIWEWCRISQIRRPQRYWFAAATLVLWVLGMLYSNFFTLLLVLSCLHYLYAVRLIWEFEHIYNYRIHHSYLTFSGPILLSTLATTLMYIFNKVDNSFTSGDAMTLTFIIMIIAAADSGAYFVGRFLGRHKLSPRVSPKKTIEGLIGGLLFVVLVCYFFNFMVEQWYLSFPTLLFIALITAVFSVIGDLFISIIKRQNNIKDASQILPGHGGILDRIDGLLAGIPIFYLLQQWM